MNPNHPAKPTSQQVPKAPLTPAQADRMLRCAVGQVMPLEEGAACSRALRWIADGSHVVISATELSALRAREERLRELVVTMRTAAKAHMDDAPKCVASVEEEMAEAIFIYARLLESILNEGKT